MLAASSSGSTETLVTAWGLVPGTQRRRETTWDGGSSDNQSPGAFPNLPHPQIFGARHPPPPPPPLTQDVDRGGGADAGHRVGGRALPAPVLLLDEGAENQAAVPIHLGADLPCAAHLRGRDTLIMLISPSQSLVPIPIPIPCPCPQRLCSDPTAPRPSQDLDPPPRGRFGHRGAGFCPRFLKKQR